MGLKTVLLFLCWMCGVGGGEEAPSRKLVHRYCAVAFASISLNWHIPTD